MLSLALALLTQTATPNLTEGVQRLPLTGTPGTVVRLLPRSTRSVQPPAAPE